MPLDTSILARSLAQFHAEHERLLALVTFPLPLTCDLADTLVRHIPPAVLRLSDRGLHSYFISHAHFGVLSGRLGRSTLK